MYSLRFPWGCVGLFDWEESGGTGKCTVADGDLGAGQHSVTGIGFLRKWNAWREGYVPIHG